MAYRETCGSFFLGSGRTRLLHGVLCRYMWGTRLYHEAAGVEMLKHLVVKE